MRSFIQQTGFLSNKVGTGTTNMTHNSKTKATLSRHGPYNDVMKRHLEHCIEFHNQNPSLPGWPGAEEEKANSW